jgi:hypothetical protein
MKEKLLKGYDAAGKAFKVHRYDRWKLVFLEQRAHGLDVWRDLPGA